jgi:hypothetical protein
MVMGFVSAVILTTISIILMINFVLKIMPDEMMIGDCMMHLLNGILPEPMNLRKYINRVRLMNTYLTINVLKHMWLQVSTLMKNIIYTNAVILYNPTTLKEAYKLARRVEKSLESHSKMLKPLNKSYFHTSFQQNPLNLVMILFYIYLLFRPNHLINELLII